MPLLQIAEPGQSLAPKTPRRAVGIDLGTTNSLVATVQNAPRPRWNSLPAGQRPAAPLPQAGEGAPKGRERAAVAAPLADKNGKLILPSAVRYLENGQIQVGEIAKAAAAGDPLNTVLSAKRLIGRGLKDIQTLGSQLPYRFVAGDSAMPFIETVQGPKSPVEVSAAILGELRQRAESALGGALDGVVITVPAYFDEAQRQATKDAARLAGLPLLRLLSEPTAAAVAYGLDNQAEGLLAVYDLGGGTFDISILRLTQGVFEVLASGGDSALGGDDFDLAIARWMIGQANLSQDLAPAQQRELLQIACSAKEALSDCEAVALSYRNWQGRLTRAQLQTLIEPLISRTLKVCRRALRDADLTAADIQTAIMVGGATRVPAVREAVSTLFGKPPLTSIDPDQVVAIGAAMQADRLVGNRQGDDLLLLDVIPLTLGLETFGGLVEKILPRGSPIPLSRAQEFTTGKDGQTAMVIHVLQGERELVADCRSLARFELRGIAPMRAGAAKVRVTFAVDADGLLSVSARDLTSDSEAHIEVKPSYGLSEAEITRMLKDSFAHAEEDKQARARREAQVEAEQLLAATIDALAQDAHLLDNTQQQAIENAAAELRRLLPSGTRDAIQMQSKRLIQLTDAFAAKRLNASVQTLLAGRRLNELEH